jgi:hypothetical protein
MGEREEEGKGEGKGMGEGEWHRPDRYGRKITRDKPARRTDKMHCTLNHKP